MDNLVIASNEADAAAAAAVEQHHAAMAGALSAAVEHLVAAAAAPADGAAGTARDHLVDWCRTELVPHALAEEKAMYPAAQAMDAGRLLVDGMIAEHGVITGLVEEVAAARDAVRAAAAAKALQVMFESHLAKENELVLPLLTAAPDVSVAELLGGMHELLGGRHDTHDADTDDHDHAHPAAGAGGGCGGHCSCGETDGPGFPELDARTVPHAIRHATIFGALDSVRSGGGLVLVAPHDPLPLLRQVEERSPGEFAVDYLQRGPDAWRLRLVRRTRS
jgi:uncharacterized protein (DUF2249 family)